MIEQFQRNGKHITLIDLSVMLSNKTSLFEPNPHYIRYSSHCEGVRITEKFLGLDASYWPDEEAWAVEEVTLSTHAGTHIDAPYHYGSTYDESPARTVDQVPLQWCYGDGVLFKMSHKEKGDAITRKDLEEELNRIGYTLKPFDIVLIYTGASKYFNSPGYEFQHSGLDRSATEYLVNQGIKLIGIDAWGLDRPFDVLAREAKEGKVQFWESHLFGREKEYLQIEKLCNLELLPKPYGFTISAFPVNIENASAGWSRVVAIIEE